LKKKKQIANLVERSMQILGSKTLGPEMGSRAAGYGLLSDGSHNVNERSGFITGFFIN
jgi:hypothetical protein